MTIMILDQPAENIGIAAKFGFGSAANACGKVGRQRLGFLDGVVFGRLFFWSGFFIPEWLFILNRLFILGGRFFGFAGRAFAGCHLLDHKGSFKARDQMASHQLSCHNR
ncbi:MAG TPA: hypothetical protein VFG34_03205 [Sphingopyxis sp.]|nr:hypothetical protein [Sphingopyxis sp.]